MIRFLLILMSVMMASVTAQAQSTTPILVDQFGYLPDLQKVAVIKNPQKGYDASLSFTPGSRLVVVNQQSRKIVFEGVAQQWKNGSVDEPSGDKIWWFDFSSLTQPGNYIIRDVATGVESHPFIIAPNVYKPVLKAAFKTFYYQRAGFEKTERFAGKGYADSASHLRRGQDSQARLFSDKKNAATERDLRGGWYDAGDYNQYTRWTANYVRGLLASYIENPRVWTDDFGIPESGNGIPDILDEVKWGLDWLERMQNPDGSMLSILGRDDAGSPPSKSHGPSYYGPSNTSATMASAGAFAMAAKVFGGHQKLRQHRTRYRDRAVNAWNWAEMNKGVKFYNNDDRSNSVGLGAGQQEVESEQLAKIRLISSVHLFALTGDKFFTNHIRKLYSEISPVAADTPNGYEGGMAFDMLYYARQPKADSRLAETIRRDYAEKMIGGYNGWSVIASREDGYRAHVDGYWWGSNAVKARRGSVYTQAVLSGISPTQSKNYLNAASDYLHYLHGVNANGKTYLSNMGAYGAENSVNSFYHLWFRDGSKLYDDVRFSRFGPAPGFLAGGPNDGYARDECCASGTCGGHGEMICKTPIASPPAYQPGAKSYTDFNDDWPNNSWSVTENSNGYQVDYLRLLSKFVR